MVACYAWSNMMIFNAMNIKLNYYSDEDMDLFVRMSPGISREFLSLVKGKDIFANVYYTNEPEIQEYGRLKKLLKLGWISHYRKCHKQYERMLHNLIGYKKYDIVLVAGFWNDSLYYIDYFYKYNRKLKVILYDEGGASYDNTKHNLCKYYCNRKITPWRSRIKRFSTEKVIELRCKHLVQNYMYLYSPERYQKIDRKMQICKIPFIDIQNKEMFSFLEQDLMSIYEMDLLPYDRKNIYFIASGNFKWIPDCESQSIVMIEALMNSVNQNDIIIKTHPNNTENRLHFAKDLENKVFVDRKNALLEFIYPNVDIENKLIITHASSSAMYVKIMFDKEPYVILIFRLFHQYHERGDKDAEKYAEDMKDLFRDKSKIYIPNTIDEYIDCIKEVKRKIIRY